MSDPTQVQRIAQLFSQHWARDRAQEPLVAIAQAKQGDPVLLQANALMAEAFIDAMGVALDVHDGAHQQLWAQAWQHVREGLVGQDNESGLNVNQLTHSALQRFVTAVDMVMEADDLSPKERMKLIGEWAYQYARPDMPEQLDAAIQRCQSNEDVHPTASSIVDKVSGEVVAYSAPSYS